MFDQRAQSPCCLGFVLEISELLKDRHQNCTTTSIKNFGYLIETKNMAKTLPYSLHSNHKKTVQSYNWKSTHTPW